MNEVECKTYIESLRSQIPRDDPTGTINKLKNMLSASLDVIELNFPLPPDPSFLLEFIQNAEDARAEKILIEFDGRNLRIENDGDSFAKENVDSICSIGSSSKKPNDYIGYLGIGFKSAFSFSEYVQVISPPWKFQFSPPGNNSSDIGELWKLFLSWISSKSAAPTHGYKTSFLLAVSPAQTKQVDNAIMNFKATILLFLHSVKDIFIRSGNFTRNVSKRSRSENGRGYEVVTLTDTTTNSSDCSETKWLVINRKFQIDASAWDTTSKKWRKSVTVRELALAFQLSDNEKEIIRLEKGSAHSSVHSHRPYPECSGVPFLIQADFLSNAGRSEIAKNCRWNEWMSEKMFVMIEENAIPVLKKNNDWKLELTNALEPDHTDLAADLFKSRIVDPLQDYLAKSDVIFSLSGRFVQPGSSVFPSKLVQRLLKGGELASLYPDKEVAYYGSKVPERIQKEGKVVTFSDLFNSKEGQGLLNQKTDNGDWKWFNDFYETLSIADLTFFNGDCEKFNSFWSEARDVALIPTIGSTLTTLVTCCNNPNGLPIPTQLQNSVHIIHNEIAATEGFGKLLDVAKISYSLYYGRWNKKCREIPTPVTQMRIDELSVNKLPAKLPDNWTMLSENERTDHIRMLFVAWRRSSSSDRTNLLKLWKHITLPATSGKWHSPEELVFGKGFDDSRELEALAKAGLLTITFQTVAANLLQQGDDTQEWKAFLSDLGVDKQDVVNNLINNVSVNCALRYEKKNGREAKEVTESSDSHYDIDSEEAKNPIRIEVKGHEGDAGFEPVLTPKEYLEMTKNPDTYFLYLVIESLSSPKLYRISGVDLIESKFKIMITKKWVDELSQGEGNYYDPMKA